MPQLNYDDMSAISYVGSDIAVLLTPLQQSLAIQALNLFTSRIMWQDWNANQALIDELVADTLLALDTSMPDTFGNTALFLTPEFDVALAGNGIVFTAEAACMHGGFWAATTAAINDERATPYVYLRAGAYRLDLFFRKGVTAGIITPYIQKDSDTPVAMSGTIDGYNNPAIQNQKDFATFTVSADGLHRIRLKSSTKNPSSSNYVMAIQSYLIRRTGD